MEKDAFQIRKELLTKYEHLLEYLRGLGRVVVAFSSGVDSSFLLKAAKDALGEEVVAVTATSSLFPQREKVEAIALCERLGVEHILLPYDELSVEGFAGNPTNRCYLCKRQLFSNLLALAKKKGCKAVVEGSNLDDEGDYRPGMQAIRELGIVSPLRACGFWKQEIRELSRHFGLPTWEKPSFACLASRFVYGETITRQKLQMVEKAEEVLLGLGFRQFRVRIHDLLARIEVLPEEFPMLMEEESRNKVVEELLSLGFTYVTMDLKGYRTGSMNETIGQRG